MAGKLILGAQLARAPMDDEDDVNWDEVIRSTDETIENLKLQNDRQPDGAKTHVESTDQTNVEQWDWADQSNGNDNNTNWEEVVGKSKDVFVSLVEEFADTMAVGHLVTAICPG